ncbi:MAM and LDL-receptor class A domain-containing protein 1 [Chionoecetes opilio]|uniref:MAM and LDL-receptor class A domain-containing protein 1 n=1 Tax=Chionoecetes opilio TaxID=41210 RepID=A0A8J4Y605_CHIOP|nr:MAM and LDL-receptor class A domain-containing protein 1 [Chionoecetes opilio]
MHDFFSPQSHIALDDLHFQNCKNNGECQSVTDFQCAADGDCIPRQYACDAKYDCRDKSDEYQCPDIKGNCNFDSESWVEDCSYRQRTDDHLDWQWASGSGQPATGPQHDHTLASGSSGSSGHYVYVSSESGTPGLLATLETIDEYPASQDICFLRLWYYMHTDLSAGNVDIGTLRVYLSGMVSILVFNATMR